MGIWLHYSIYSTRRLRYLGVELMDLVGFDDLFYWFRGLELLSQLNPMYLTLEVHH